MNYFFELVNRHFVCTLFLEENKQRNYVHLVGRQFSVTSRSLQDAWELKGQHAREKEPENLTDQHLVTRLSCTFISLSQICSKQWVNKTVSVQDTAPAQENVDDHTIDLLLFLYSTTLTTEWLVSLWITPLLADHHWIVILLLLSETGKNINYPKTINLATNNCSSSWLFASPCNYLSYLFHHVFSLFIIQVIFLVCL